MASQRSRTMLVVLLIAALLQTAVAVEHIVGGGTVGWTFQAENFYNDWAKGQDIRVGDTLKFNWVSEHDVVQLSTTATEACDLTANEIEKWTTAGVSVPLPTAGTFGYICSIGTHCSQGFMKMTVTVAAADSSTSPPPPSTSTPPPPPPPTSAASSLMQFYQLALLAAVAAAAAVYAY